LFQRHSQQVLREPLVLQRVQVQQVLVQESVPPEPEQLELRPHHQLR
jgi:hypothetical protein